MYYSQHLWEDRPKLLRLNFFGQKPDSKYRALRNLIVGVVWVANNHSVELQESLLRQELSQEVNGIHYDKQGVLYIDVCWVCQTGLNVMYEKILKQRNGRLLVRLEHFAKQIGDLQLELVFLLVFYESLLFYVLLVLFFVFVDVQYEVLSSLFW